MLLKKLVILCIVLSCVSVVAQDPILERGDAYYEGFVYSKAIRSYEKVLKKKGPSVPLLLKLGNSYYFNSSFQQAEKYYREAIEIHADLDPEIFFRFAHTLKAGRKYKEANEWMEVFSREKPNDSRTRIYYESMNYLEEIKRRSGRYSVEPQDFNTKYNDFGPAFGQRQLIFASGINSDGSAGKVAGVDGEAGYFDLYAIPVNSSLDVMGAKAYPLVGDINTKLHESTPAITADGTTMYFTRNNYYKGKRGKTEDGRVLLKIYKATKVLGKWGDIKELPFCSDEYSVAHPALSPDEKTLYFAYSGPGALGQSDIYYVTIDGEDSYSFPKNLSTKINTDGRESFPFVTKSNLLFYASDGKQGLGALDIYVADLNTIGETYFEAFNVGAPINSVRDDFAFVLDEELDKGFFSSNREGGQGEDDIYGFTRTEVLNVKCAGIIKGIAKDATDFVLLSNETIILLDVNGNELERVTSDENGNFAFNLNECRDDAMYNFKAILNNQKESENVPFLYKKDQKDIPVELRFEFEKEMNLIEDVEKDITDLVNFDPIYFDFGNAKIRPRESPKLLKVIYFLRENPNVRLVISSHADSRSGDEFNQKLSERRAKATKKYLVNWKIDPDRLTIVGYGETKLTNQCTNDIRCSEAEHRLNRRSEFQVIETLIGSSANIE